MRISEVLRFIRERDHQLVAPEVLDLPPASDYAKLGVTRGRGFLVEALLAGNEQLARQIVFDLYRARHPLPEICDNVIAAAFHDIGDRWACQAADPYQERRGCEIALRILFDLRRLQPEPDDSWRAIGGTVEGDFYVLSSAMVELVLRESGWNAISLGSSLPFASLARAVQETKPKLMWVSVSHIRDGLDFVSGFTSLSQACQEEGSALVVGGRALTEDIRRRMTYSAFCDTMQHLVSFVHTLKMTSLAGHS
jgi:methanogenic corrinoid protein MtbC1